jgi:hypothetical protein
VKHLKPKLIVELGTYWGTSFFSFCQSVKDHALGTKCLAIDTWEGDDHTGTYDHEVFENVEKIRSRYYTGVAVELKRKLFSEAVKEFESESIDLLHIDGLHTYKAVAEDYHAWLPKLAVNGVVLFHDIADTCEYGSVRFWKELSEVCPSYTFQHSWGLGILFPKGDAFYAYMEQNNFTDKQKVYAYKSELALARLQVNDLERFNKEQDAIIKNLERRLEKEISVHQGLSAVQDQLNSSNMFRLLRRIGFFTG